MLKKYCDLSYAKLLYGKSHLRLLGLQVTGMGIG